MIGQHERRIKLEVRTVGVDSALRRIGLATSMNGKVQAFLVKGRGTGARRLLGIRKEVLACIDKFAPNMIAIEGYSFGSTGRWFDLGEIGGVLKVEFEERGISTLVVPPSLLKKFATGNGAAPKKWVIRAVKERCGYETEDDNLADAVMLARFAEVYVTGNSQYRSELDAVRRLRETEKPKAPKRQLKSLIAV